MILRRIAILKGDAMISNNADEGKRLAITGQSLADARASDSFVVTRLIGCVRSERMSPYRIHYLYNYPEFHYYEPLGRVVEWQTRGT